MYILYLLTQYWKCPQHYTINQVTTEVSTEVSTKVDVFCVIKVFRMCFRKQNQTKKTKQQMVYHLYQISAFSTPYELLSIIALCH